MKLRIKGNSLRLRVSRSELDALLASGRLEETIYFAAANDAALTYSLRHEAAAAARLDYKPGEVAVILPTAETRAWAASGQEGIYANLDLGARGQLELAVEKDFACLDLSDEENADTFPNPNAASKACNTP